MEKLKMRGFFKILLLLMLALIIPGAAFGKDKVATLKGIKGVVEVKSGGGWTAASDGMALYAQDSVRTKLSAECQIVFNAGHNVKMSSLSTIVVAAPRKPKKGDKDANPTSDVKVNFGKVFAKVKKSTTGTPTKFEIATPTAVAGIRGTMLAEEVESESGNTGGAAPDTPPDNPPADPVCTTTVAEGEVVVSNDAGEEVDVKEGQEVTADATGDLPEEASPMSEENKGDWDANKEWVEQVEAEVETAVPGETPPATETATTPSTETPATTETATAPEATTAAEGEVAAAAETSATDSANAAINDFLNDPENLGNLEELNTFGFMFTAEQQDVADLALSGDLNDLLASGVDLTGIQDAEDAAVLEDAAESGTLDDLLAAGIDLSDMDAELWASLEAMAEEGKLNIDDLLAAGIDINDIEDAEDAAVLNDAAAAGTLDDLLAAGMDISDMDAELWAELEALAENGTLDDLLAAGVDLTQIDSVDELLTAATDAGVDSTLIGDIISDTGAEDAATADTTQDEVGTVGETFDVPETPDDALVDVGTDDVTVDEETFTQ